MLLEKRKRSLSNIYSKSILSILLLFGMILLTACGVGHKKEKPESHGKEIDKWQPQEITKTEKDEAQKEVKEISKICQNIKINQNKPTKKELEKIYQALTDQGYPTAQIGEETHSTKNAPVKFKPSKTSHGKELKEFYQKTKQGEAATITLLQQNSSGGFARIKLESVKSKTIGILTTIYREENGNLSVSEMVKYKVKKIKLNDKDILTLEFYLSDQAELQTDGTMEFQL